MQDTIILDTPIPDDNPFANIERIPSEIAHDAFDFLITLNDDSTKDWQDFTKPHRGGDVALVIDGKIIDIISIRHKLDHEFVIIISDIQTT